MLLKLAAEGGSRDSGFVQPSDQRRARCAVDERRVFGLRGSRAFHAQSMPRQMPRIEA